MSRKTNWKDAVHRWCNGLITGPEDYSSKHFDVDVFRHYSTNIARRITYRGRKAVIIDVGNYGGGGFGVSTQSIARNIKHGCPPDVRVFTAPVGRRGLGVDAIDTPKKLLAWHLTQYSLAIVSHNIKAIQASQFLDKVHHLDNAIEVATFFKLAKAKLLKLRAKHQPAYEACIKLVDEREEKLRAARDKREETRKAREAVVRQRRIDKAVELASSDELLRQVEDLRCFNDYYWGDANSYSLLNGRDDLKQRVRDEQARRDALTREDWLNNVPHAKAPEGETLLRVDGEDVETSRYARVPLAAAERTFRFVWARRAQGWHRNGETHVVGNYSLEAVNEQGLVIGCHRITWAEVERFARSQGWLNVSG